jgi:methylmalonyl-CoA mutase, N-terminal domain
VKLPDDALLAAKAPVESGRERARARWLGAVETLAARHPERCARFATDSHIEVERLYEPDAEFDPSERLGYRGFYPFTRGIHPNLYRGKLWTMRQYAGYGSAEESNARYKYLLAQGTTGLSVAFDLPTQIGYDSDHPAAAGEVGRVGVAVASIDDMRVLFDGIPLERISTSMTINATAAVLMALYIAVARERGIAESTLAGTVQNDILKEYIARGTYIFPPRPSMRLTTDIIAYCRDHLPQWNTMSISGYHIREAGANAVQELAFTFANAIAYVEAARAAGLAVDDFAPRLAFFWGCHNNLFEEVAKFRASRRIWAKLMRERFGARDERSLMLRFHTQTAGCSLTAQQPMNNAVRVTIQALAAVLGGTQSLHTNAMDEALSLPTEESARLALRTQQIIANESGVADTVDPVGGSYFVEALTDRLEAEVLGYLRRIDELGGAIAAIERHYFQNEIAAEAYRYQSEIESAERVIVGVNRFTDDDDISPPRLQIDPAIEMRQTQRLAELRRTRDNEKLSAALAVLQMAAKTDENLMPPLIHAVEQRATLGEIADILRAEWGEFQDTL